MPVGVRGVSIRSKFRHGHWGAAPFRNPKEPTRNIRREENHTVAVPCSASAGSCGTEGYRWPTRHGDLFQASMGEESNECALWRPKRIGCVFRSGHDLCLERIE